MNKSQNYVEMEYFDLETDRQEGQQEEQQIEQLDEAVVSAPSPQKKIQAETIEIKNKSVINYLIPRENKKWHFTLSDNNKDQLTKTIESIPDLTVEYADKKDDAGITLKMNNDIVGKIHFLLCDRPDVNLRDKYYCKLYFYEFKNQELYNKVKTSLVNFFENFKPITSGGRYKKRITRKKNKRMQRKKTNKKVAKK